MAVTNGLGEINDATSTGQARNPAETSLRMVPTTVPAPGPVHQADRMKVEAPRARQNRSSTEKLEVMPAMLAMLHGACWVGASMNRANGYKQHISCIVLCSGS